MIGVSVGDIIKLLDQIPIWKTVSALPKRIKELEDRVAALEAKPASKEGEACALCGEPMRVESVHRPRSSAMDRVGIKEHQMVCTACPHTERKLHDPHGMLGKLKQ